MASYNYLGFAESSGLCAEAAMAEVQDTGLSPGSSRLELGGLGIHKKLEEEVANFLGVEVTKTLTKQTQPTEAPFFFV